ncbi:MAG: Exodeoxyribonuclease [Myxococcota bacterium]|nr:Exodeoxyribonuclease [Myxococcota bacterium]
MKIISWNVNGIRSAEKKGLVDSIVRMKPDILGLQEVRAEEHQIPLHLRAVEDLKSYWSACRRKAGYSGVGLYTRREPVRLNRDLGVEEFDEEGRVIEAEYPDFVIFNVYFPNGSGTDRSNSRVPFKLAFYGALLEHAAKHRKKGREVIIMGDYNTAHQKIDLKNWRGNQETSGFLPEEREWMSRYLDAGYVDSFRHFHPDREGAYSWWSFRMNARERNVGWRVDYVLVSSGLVPRLKNAFILPDVTGSDHCPVGIELE